MSDYCPCGLELIVVERIIPNVKVQTMREQVAPRTEWPKFCEGCARVYVLPYELEWAHDNACEDGPDVDMIRKYGR